MGRYSREKQYSDAIERKLKEINIPYEREYNIRNSGNVIDFIIDNKMVLEVKAKRFVTREDHYQTQRYLQTLNKKLGLIVNFRNRFLKPLRIIKIDTKAKNKFV